MRDRVMRVVTDFGDVGVPEPIRHSALLRALRKYRALGAVKVADYQDMMIYRWARATAFLLWKQR
jgi:hypothetical protein